MRPQIHDDGTKTVLGRSGNFDGDAVLDILLAQPATAEFIVAKLWREFVSPTPDAAEIKRIARMFRDNRYNIKVALRALLTADAFYAAQNRAALIKSPVDLIVGTMRQFRFETGDVAPLVLASRQLGQDIFAPPNVKGWPGRRSLDQQRDAAAAQAVARTAIPRAGAAARGHADDTNGGGAD